MKCRLLILFLMVCGSVFSQGPPVGTYTNVANGYNWLRGYFKALHGPAGQTPILQPGQWPGAGATFLDSLGGGKGFHWYLDQSWKRGVDSSELADTAASIRGNLGGNPIDLFAIFGDSNGQGWGNSSLSPAIISGIAFQYYSNTLTAKTADPIGNATTGSAWPAFANTWYTLTGRKICFVPMGLPATTMNATADGGLGNWDSTGTLLDTGIARTQRAMAALSAAGYTVFFRGVLTGLGGNDAIAINTATITQAAYIQSFTKFRARIRAAFGHKTPIYIHQLGKQVTGTDAGHTLIRAAQVSATNADSLTNIVFWNAQYFISRSLQTDQYHYTQSGYNEMGRIMAEQIVNSGGNKFQEQGNNIWFSKGNVGIGITKGVPTYQLDVSDSIRVSGLSISRRGFAGAPSINTTEYLTLKPGQDLMIIQSTAGRPTELRFAQNDEGTSGNGTTPYVGVINGFNYGAGGVADRRRDLLLGTSGTSNVAGNIRLKPGIRYWALDTTQVTKDSVIVELNSGATFSVLGGKTYLNDTLATPNIETKAIDTTNLKHVVVDANGNHFKMNWAFAANLFGVTDNLFTDNRYADMQGNGLYLDSGKLIIRGKWNSPSDSAFVVSKGGSEVLRVDNTTGTVYTSRLNAGGGTFTVDGATSRILNSTALSFELGGYIKSFQQPLTLERNYPITGSPYIGVLIKNDTLGTYLDLNDTAKYNLLEARFTSFLDATERTKFLVRQSGAIWSANYPSGTGASTDSAVVVRNGILSVVPYATIGSGGGGGAAWGAITGTLSDQTDLQTALDLKLLKAGDAYTTTTGNGLDLTTSTLTSGNLVNLSYSGTGAASSTQTVLNITTTGTNATASMTTNGAIISNSHDGTGAKNRALTLSATGATVGNRQALYIPFGAVGIGIDPTAFYSTAGDMPLQIAGHQGWFEGTTMRAFMVTTTNAVLTLRNGSAQNKVVLNTAGLSYIDGGNLAIRNGATGTSYLHIGPPTTAASTGQIKLGEGPGQTTPEDGTINYVSNNLEFVETSTVYRIAKTLSATASLNFNNTLAQSSDDLTITVTGAVTGDPVALAIPHAAATTGTAYVAWVSSSDTVTVRFNNYSSGAIDPSSASFTVSVIHF